MKNKVSIILPVYNAESFIRKTLTSVLEQTYSNFELIIVNDGSSDNTKDICQEFEIRDNRIKLFSKENKGVSSARNLGLEKITGEFLLFLDGDDFWPENYIKNMIDTLQKYPKFMIMTGIDNIDHENRIISQYPIVDKNVRKFSYFSLYRTILQPGGWGGYPVNKLYKVDIIKTNKLRFNESLHFCEDQVFNIQYINYVDGAITSPEKINYKRLVHNKSIVNSRNHSTSFNVKWEDVFKAKELIRNDITNNIKLNNRERYILNLVNLYAWKQEYITLSTIAQKVNYRSVTLEDNFQCLVKAGVFSKIFDIKNWYFADKRKIKLFSFFIPSRIRKKIRKKV
ncbi:glycosyltransferase family 2 protein [Enterococcus gallinarum]|uniref:glycosyltransferase family 2 protein n=1 Tax=Enterococcus gallinarum TaxID=1353 RepID=UPI0029549F59|nr:glycosyltransferase family 2 protein [Enterococcus gallinarum]MDV7785567.1 glycosyltransferase family 2 protein [Enterococcus gallinarum]